MLDQRVRPAKACRPDDKLEVAGYGHRGINSAFDDKGKHRSVTAHLSRSQIVSLIILQAWKEHFLDARMRRQGHGDFLGAFAMSTHADRQCLQPP